MDAFVGTILPVAFPYAPEGWRLCDGSKLMIMQNQALYAVIGSTYGGDNSTYFLLPNLLGRIPLNQGSSPGTQNYKIGSSGGVETVTLNMNQMPTHTHSVNVVASAGSTINPANQLFAQVNNPNADVPFESFSGSNSNIVQLSTAALSSQGGGTAHENRQPYLTINYIICVSGFFPVKPS